MIRALRVAVAVLAATLLSPSVDAQAQSAEALAIRRTVAANGLRIFTLPDEQAERFRLVALVGAGARHDPVDARGLANLVQLCRLISTAKRNRRVLERALSAHHANPVGHIAHDYTTFQIEVSREHWRFAVEWLGEILSQPAVDEEDFQRTCRDLVQALDADPTPAERSKRDRMAVLYPDHALGHDVDGRAPDIERIGRAGLRRFHKKHYVGGNVVIGCSGGVPDECHAAIAAATALLPAKPAAAGGPPPRPFTGVKDHSFDPQTPFLVFDQGYQLRADRPEELLHQAILREYLRQRLLGRLRDEPGLANDPAVALHQFVDTQRLAFAAGAVSVEGLATLAELIDDLVAEAATPGSDVHAKARGAVEREFRITAVDRLRRTLRLCWLYEAMGGHVTELLPILRQLRPAGTGEYARRELIEDNRYSLRATASASGFQFVVWITVVLLGVFLLIDGLRGFPTAHSLAMFLRVSQARRQHAYEQKQTDGETITPISGDDLVKNIQEYYEDEDRRL